jgi:hypothetical protein
LALIKIIIATANRFKATKDETDKQYMRHQRQRRFDDIKSFSLRLTEAQVAEYSRRMRLIMSRPIQKRYDLFSASHPHLIGRDNQRFLASYLGMSRAAFSAAQLKKHQNRKTV